jgi:hypothetical protein
MGLINLLTDPKNFKFYVGGQGYTGNGAQPSLTNIPYGKDQIGGGSSGQPYIQIPIPDNISNLGATNKDFILRGGTLTVQNSATDALRLTKMFGDLKSPSGLLFIAKQQLLSRTAVRTQSSGVGLNEGIYNPLTTIAQAGVVAFGVHLNKQSLIIPYSETVTNKQQPENNRLYGLYNEKVLNNKFSTPGLKGFATDLINLNPLLMSYSGGPGSTLGVGKTNIRFADQRTGANNPLAITNPNYFYSGSVRSIDTLNNSQISQGGILINTNQLWTTTGKYNVYNINSSGRGKTKLDSISLGLPLFDVNTLQSLGTSLQVNNTQKPETREGTASLIYNPTNIPKTVSGQYGSSFPNVDLFPILSYNSSSGEKLYVDSVYTTTTISTQNGGIINKHLNPTPLINAQGTYTYTQQDLVKLDRSGGTIQDFRARLRNPILTQNQTLKRDKAAELGQLTAAPNYTNKSIETRVNIGGPDGDGPGSRANKNYANYTNGVIYSSKKSGALDKINALPIYTGSSVALTEDQPVNDLIKFRIAIIDNDAPTSKTFVHFRAFLDSISDAYTAEWNSVKYLGRGENFYTYGGYTRQMSLSWTVAAQSKQELIPMYKKLNYLASSLTPSYSTLGYMRGNMVQLTIGGYVYEQPGIITGLTYTLEADTTWEIGINANGGSDSDVKELPHIIRVTGFNFIPIQKFRPEIQKYEDDYKHYISLANGDGVKDNNYKSLPPDVSTTIIQNPKTDTDLTGTGILLRDPADAVGPRQPQNNFTNTFETVFNR